jgi:hypothetical protein
MGSGQPMVNIRVKPEELAALDAAAHGSGLDRSAWCREVLLAAAQSLRTLEEILAFLATTGPGPALRVRLRAAVVRELGVWTRQIRQVITARGKDR